ncbi:MAG: type II toxin-antitoxin system VapC family toxin [Rubrivivax sp.]
MKLLLDTCTFLWAVRGDAQLSRVAVALFRDPANEVFLSAVSAWEIAVKHALGKLPLADAPASYVPRERQRHGIDALPLDEAATLMLDKLPAVHTDPFDRLLVCQAIQHGLTLLTPDAAIHRYPVPVQW